ncbi:MAG TPA: hypothetical protein VF461_05875 [Gemmatimonadaceae bacterium]
MTHPQATAALDRFVRSLFIDYEKWHDGVGFDLDALREVTPDERKVAEARLDATHDWRDVEALTVLAELGSPSAERALRDALKSGSQEIRLAIMKHAPHLVDNAARTEMLLNALDVATPFDAFTDTLDQVEKFHPPPIVDALWRGLTTRQGDVAVHYAAMLAFIYGKADSTFDWSMRPLFLKFNTKSDAERRAAIAELRKRIDAKE